MLYKQIENGFIPYLGNSTVIPQTAVEITENEYNQLMETIKTKPDDTLESIYRLSADTLQYASCERSYNEIIQWYLEKVMNSEMIVDEVPTEYKAEVESLLPTEKDPEQAFIDEIVKEVSESE